MPFNELRYLNNWLENGGGAKFTGHDYEPSSTNQPIPIFDLSEVIVKDNTSMNRVNILSFDANSAYTSYIGVQDGQDADKSILVIGTSDHNVNIGTRTMSNGDEVFSPQREININFDNTRISSYAYIGNDAIFQRDTISYGVNWTRYDDSGITYWTCTYKPIGRFLDKSKSIVLKAEGQNPKLDEYVSVKPIDKNYVFSQCFIYDILSENNVQDEEEGGTTTLAFVEPIYVGDAINIPGLIGYVAPQIDFSNVSEVSSNIPIITDDTTYIALVSSNINGKTNYEKICTGSLLNITYYCNAESKYIFNIEENESSHRLSIPQKLQTNY